ncbi:hypothetical protein [Viridibacillus arvi]|uniref:hypothetical protein n=1 Tax=Viridibacillus arvi TaxID=263475 RepID=UPI0034CEDB42
MSSAATKALYLGAALFLAIALITIVVNIYSSSTEAAKAAPSSFSQLSTELKDQQFSAYDNTTVSGSQVINSIRRFSTEGNAGNMGLKITTGQNVSTWYYNTVSTDGNSVTKSSADNTEVTNSVSTQYVNPSGTFSAKIIRDSNQVIRAITFTQQK